MANNPLLNELIEEKVYPIVDSIKGFFGSFGIADRLTQPGSNTGGSPTRSGTPIASSPSYIDARASLQTCVTIPERYLASSNLPPFIPPRSFSPPADVGFHINGLSSSSAVVLTTPIAPRPTAATIDGTTPAHDSTSCNSASTSSTPNHVTTTGNQRTPGAPTFVAGSLHQQSGRTGSFHGDVSRPTKGRLVNSPLRATASVDSATGSFRNSGTESETSSSSRRSNFSSLSSQFRQTFAERGSSHRNVGGISSSIDHHHPDGGGGDQSDITSTLNNGGNHSGTSGSATAAAEDDDDSGDEYAATLAASAGADKLGRLQFSVSYDFDALTLTVKIIKAESLAAKDISGTSDPYVKISLLPDKKHTLTTNIKRKNLNPRWNEVFAFEGFPYNKVVTKTLHLLVLDYDRFSRDDPIGEVCLPLGDFDLATGQTMWKTLLPCKGAVGKLGVLQLSLCYQPTDESITVEIIKARDLKAKDINGLSDPYVKIWMTHEGKKIEKKKTSVKERNLNPIFNETFLFTVPYERIRQTSLVVSVMDYDRMGRNEAIGQLVLGPKSAPIEMKHWNEMFAKTRQAVTQWHLLKDFG